MSYKKIAFSLLILTGLNYGCNHSDPKVIARIDSVLVVLDSTSKMAASIDFEKEEETAKKIEADLDFIQDNFKDTLDMTTAALLKDYKAINAEEEEEGKGNENYALMLKKELEFTKQQLLNLKHDFERTDIKPEEFEKYFVTESTTVGKLNAFVAHKRAEFFQKEKQFNAVQPKVQEFIESIKK